MLKIQFYFDYASCWTIYPSSAKCLNVIYIYILKYAIALKNRK